MFRLRVPAQEAKPGAPLAPILGQQQIKVADFVTQFNKASAGWLSGTPLGCRVSKEPGGKFNLQVCPPTWTTLLGGSSIDRQDLYYLVGYRFGQPTPITLRLVFGTLKSLKLTVR